MEYETSAEIIGHVAKIARHYPYHLTGTIPEGKDPLAVDAKLAELYLTELTRTERQRRRRQGLSNALYLRCGRVWVLLATAGTGFIWESEPLRDMQHTPLVLFSHAVRLCARAGGRFSVQVQVEACEWEKTRSRLLRAALMPSPWVLRADMRRAMDELGVLPYAGTLQQQRALLTEVNKRRRAAGLTRINVTRNEHRSGMV